MKERKYQIWRYREAIKNLVFKDMKTSYCNTVMGLLWSLVVPLVTFIVYWLVFGVFINVGKENMPLYLITGILPWNYFSIAIVISTTVMLTHGSLIKKIYFPRVILPIASVMFQFTLFLIALLVFFPIMIFLGAHIHWPILLYPLIFLLQFLFTVGLASLVATVMVFFRDLKQIVDLALLVGFWMTPIVYDIRGAGGNWEWILRLNPMTSYVYAYQDVAYLGQWPSAATLAGCVVWAAVFPLIGGAAIYAFEDRFTQEL